LFVDPGGLLRRLGAGGGWGSLTTSKAERTRLTLSYRRGAPPRSGPGVLPSADLLLPWLPGVLGDKGIPSLLRRGRAEFLGLPLRFSTILGS